MGRPSHLKCCIPFYCVHSLALLVPVVLQHVCTSLGDLEDVSPLFAQGKSCLELEPVAWVAVGAGVQGKGSCR